ncbi:MAG: sigma 54-interacting transcriptional regulator [Desulfobacterales bacterium]|jgi:two-component system, NtrC family, response regulator AtoC|nr:sigma 54-interacting transcriptional regulator [Desulfobacterales bacterium]
MPKVKGLFASPITLSKILDEIPMGALILCPDRKVVMINRALEALTGFSNDDVVGTPCYHILRGRVCLNKCPVKNNRGLSEPASMESDIISNDRQLIPVRVTIAPLLSYSGERLGFIETVEDLRPIRELDEKRSHAYSFSNIIGRSPQIEKIFRILPVLSQSDASILITGETGTGKDLVAEAIHKASDRSKGPFIKINCGALPETLLESELFGHKKGAFTGAVEDKPGRFKLAHNGTLFLTEIGDLPLALQVKLLTFLDDHVIYPLGSTKGIQANVRMITATHRNLEQMVREGRFREDLLFRLNVAVVHLPPLREREGDIRLLIDHFINTFSGKSQKNVTGVSDETMNVLMEYLYFGNIRELRNIVEYSVSVCRGSRVELSDLPAYLTDRSVERTTRDTGTEVPPYPVVSKRLTGDSTESTTPGQIAGQTWSQRERGLILDALENAGGRRAETAKIMGWGRSTLWRKMKLHNIVD